MINGKRKWDKNIKDMKTNRNKFMIRDMKKLIDKIENDPDSEKRLEMQMCRVCLYSSRMAGQAFTDSNCGFCETTMTFSSTDTDILCQRCAIMNNACKHCGGEMD